MLPRPEEVVSTARENDPAYFGEVGTIDANKSLNMAMFFLRREERGLRNTTKKHFSPV